MASFLTRCRDNIKLQKFVSSPPVGHGAIVLASGHRLLRTEKLDEKVAVQTSDQIDPGVVRPSVPGQRGQKIHAELSSNGCAGSASD